MKREAILIVPDELARSLASLRDWSGRWRFTPSRRSTALDRLNRPTGLPDCLILHLRAIDHSGASEVMAVARSAGVRVAIAVDHDVPQLRTLLGLMQTDAVELLPSGTECDGRYRTLLDAFPRASIHARLTRALSPRLSRLPDLSLIAVCRDLVTGDLIRTSTDTSGGGERSLSRHLRSFGLSSAHSLRRSARLAIALDVAQTQRINRAELSRIAGFLSERTLAATSRSVLGMSLRDAMLAFDDNALSRTLAGFCLRARTE